MEKKKKGGGKERRGARGGFDARDGSRRGGFAERDEGGFAGGCGVENARRM